MSILYYCDDDDGTLLSALRQRLADTNIIDWQDQRTQLPHSDITSAVVWMPPADFFDGLTRLREIYVFAAGVDQLLAHPGLPANATIIRLRDAGMAQQMAEYCLYGVLHHQRRMMLLRRAQREARWAHEIQADLAAQTRVGILGAGALGSRVAERLALNGYPVTCWSRTGRTPKTPGWRSVHGAETLDAFLASSDILICLLPLTTATTGILDAALFCRLPRGAFLINPGRGGHQVEDELLAALASGQLSGAMLDVFSTEPLPVDHPFWAHPAIIITPHIAARSLVSESVEQIISSMEAIERGDSPQGIVDRQRGY
ncbi:MAG: glyoxylate/hydroxypyruvate reductase A [Granulosicoccus sp.]|nr:glyoxylate/hydroxypyruvate reductase A [Granulosicoccus sp.]